MLDDRTGSGGGDDTRCVAEDGMGRGGGDDMSCAGRDAAGKVDMPGDDVGSAGGGGKHIGIGCCC